MTTAETLTVVAAWLQVLTVLAALAGAGWIARREARRAAFTRAAEEELALGRGRETLALCVARMEQAHALLAQDGGGWPYHPDADRWIRAGLQLIDRSLAEVPPEPRLVEALLGMRAVLQNGAANVVSPANTENSAIERNRVLETWMRIGRRLLEDYDAGRDYVDRMPGLPGAFARPL